MKRNIIILCLFSFLLIAVGCNNNAVVHQDPNLIITNYSAYELATITIGHDDKIIIATEESIKDTQLCYFNLESANKVDFYDYTVSFVDNNGEEHFRDFSDNFTESEPILIAIKYENNQWLIDYDNSSN